MSKPPAPGSLLRSLLGCGEKNKKGDLTQSPACTQGWGWEAHLESLALFWGQGTPQPTGPAHSGSCPPLVCWGFKLEQGLLKCWWLKVLRLLVEASMRFSKEHDCAPVGDPKRGQCHPQGCSHRAVVAVSLTKAAARTVLTPGRVKGEKPASYKTLPSPRLNSTTPWGPSAQTQPEATNHPLSPCCHLSLSPAVSCLGSSPAMHQGFPSICQ